MCILVLKGKRPVVGPEGRHLGKKFQGTEYAEYGLRGVRLQVRMSSGRASCEKGFGWERTRAGPSEVLSWLPASKSLPAYPYY